MEVSYGLSNNFIKTWVSTIVFSLLLTTAFSTNPNALWLYTQQHLLSLGLYSLEILIINI